MCGICGMAGFKDQDLLKRMCGAISHRGPDDEGYFFAEDVAFGMRRLSIIDLETGQQPLTDAPSSLQGLRLIWQLYEAEPQGRIADLRGLGIS